MPPITTTPSRTNEIDATESLYINVTVKDHAAAVRRKVEKKIDGSSLPHPIKAVVHQTAPRLAGDLLVTPQQMAGQLSNKLADKIPRRLASKGVTAAVNPAFHRGPYVVLTLRVVHVDVLRMINHHSDPAAKTSPLLPTDRANQDKGLGDAEAEVVPATLGEAARQLWDALRRQRRCAGADLRPKFLTLLWMLLFWIVGPDRRRWLESVALPRIVQRKMVPSLQEMLDRNMERKHLVADCVVLTEAEQCRYFFGHLSELQQQQQDVADRSAPPGGLLPVAVLSPALLKQASKAALAPVPPVVGRRFARREKLP